MFLPTTKDDLKRLGWDKLDIILVTGDSYIDSPFIGTAVIGKVLLKAGYRVGIIAQPDLRSGEDITRMGEPALFWGVSGGSVDSMVANYTALGKKRKSDDFTPGGLNNRRPDRAVIVYANLIRRYFKSSLPIVLGGIEASLRRVPHYDFWTDRIRGSILFDAKADWLVYGMGESTVLELANSLKEGKDPRAIRGLCYISKESRAGYLVLPPFQEVAGDKQKFIEMFHTFYRNNDPISAIGLCQKHGDRYLIQNPPPANSSQAELDSVYALDFERAQHPYYEAQGQVKALETIRHSIYTHRGCYGECSFCAIAVHEGRTVRWRSPESILDEARKIAGSPGFKGYIFDIGGPTANMYGFECDKKLSHGSCPKKRCLFPEVCSQLKVNHAPQLALLRQIRQIKGIRKVFVASGIRYDMLLSDQKHGLHYLREIIDHHISGQLKIAPEHTQDHVLSKMGKPDKKTLIEFKAAFDKLNKACGKKQFLTYYLIAAHPGCSEQDMRELKAFAGRVLKTNPEQVQIFTPTPSTYASLMYYTEQDPLTGEAIFVEKTFAGKEWQKQLVVKKRTPHGRR